MSKTSDFILANYFNGHYRHVEINGDPSVISYIRTNWISGSSLMQIGYALPKNGLKNTYAPFEKVAQKFISDVTITKRTGNKKKPTEVSTVTARVMVGNVVDRGGEINTQYSRNVQRLSNQVDDTKKKYLDLITENYNRVSEIPPLVLLVNPDRIVASYEQSSDLAVGRRAHIVSNWLEKPIEITADGSTLGFYSMGPSTNFKTEEDGAGISNSYRINSLAYGNFMSLLSLYLDNANISLKGDQNPNTADIPVGIANLYLYYDGTYYLGSFDTMSVSESADKPFTLRYSFTFHARFCYKF